MAHEDLNRVLNQVRPTPEQEDAMLMALLREERKVSHMKMGRKMPRLAVAGLAAAILATTCAAAVVMGLDGRLLSYFGGTPETEGLLTSAAMVVDKRIKDHGSTLHVRQLVADRYSAVILMGFTAPEGTVLNGDHYVLGSKLRGTAADGTKLSAWGNGYTLLEDEDPGDNHITLLYRVDFIDEDINALGATLTLDFDGLYSDNTTKDCLAQGHWKCKVTLPETDPGRYVTPDFPIVIEGQEVTLTSLYLSPISLAWELGEGKDDLEFLRRSDLNYREDWPEQVSLGMTDGRTLSPGEIRFLLTQYKAGPQEPPDRGCYCFSLPEIVDPAEIVSVSIFGQSFEMTK